MVEYLEIFGEKYPVRISYYVMKKVKEETGDEFQEAIKNIEDSGNIELHETILYHALEMGAVADGGDISDVSEKFDKDDMAMALDVCFNSYIDLFSSETFFPKKLREAAEENQLQPSKGKNQGNGQKKEKAKRTK